MTTSFKKVVALTKGLEVLRATSLLKGGTVGALHDLTGLDKATIVRFLETLVAEGYVAKTGSQELPAYTVTRKVMQLSSGFVLHGEVSRVGDMLLDKYVKRLRWPLTIATFDGDSMVVAGSRGTIAGLDTIRRRGYRFPMLVTAAGLAYLPFLSADERNDILDHLARTADATGWNSLAKDRPELEKLFAKIRRQGYALGDESYYQQRHDGILWGVSVPIIGRHMVYGIVGLMILAHVQRRGEGLKALVPPLQEFAAEIAETLDRLGNVISH